MSNQRKTMAGARIILMTAPCNHTCAAKAPPVMPASWSFCRMTSTLAGCSTWPGMKWPGAADAVNSRCGTAAAAAQGAGVAQAATAAAARPLLGALLHADLVAAAAFTAVRWNRAASQAPALALGGAMARRLSRRRGRGPRQNDTRDVVLMDRGRGRGAARHPTAAAAVGTQPWSSARGSAGVPQGVVWWCKTKGAVQAPMGPHLGRREAAPGGGIVLGGMDRRGWHAGCSGCRPWAAYTSHMHTCAEHLLLPASPCTGSCQGCVGEFQPLARISWTHHLQLFQPVQGVCYTAEISNRKWVGNQVREARGEGNWHAISMK